MQNVISVIGGANVDLSATLFDSFIAAGIDTSGKKHGPHAFRSSMASSMVNDGGSYEIARRILGHSDPNVIKHYARTDIENLRLCSIDPPAPSGLDGGRGCRRRRKCYEN